MSPTYPGSASPWSNHLSFWQWGSVQLRENSINSQPIIFLCCLLELVTANHSTVIDARSSKGLITFYSFCQNYTGHSLWDHTSLKIVFCPHRCYDMFFSLLTNSYCYNSHFLKTPMIKRKCFAKVSEIWICVNIVMHHLDKLYLIVKWKRKKSALVWYHWHVKPVSRGLRWFQHTPLKLNIYL